MVGIDTGESDGFFRDVKKFWLQSKNLAEPCSHRFRSGFNLGGDD